MGGQFGAKGYILQAISAILMSFEQSDWISICLEPNDEDEKVDIKWTMKKNSAVVCQVKSSINNFSKADILTWLEELCMSCPNACELRLTLLGTFTQSTKTFCNNFSSEIETVNGYEILKEKKEIIKIICDSSNIVTLTNAVENQVGKFLSDRNMSYGYSIIKAITNDLKIKVFESSTIGHPISCHDFEKGIVSWISSLEIVRKANIHLNFFSKGHFSSIISPPLLETEIDKVLDLENKKDSLLQQINTISNFDFGPILKKPKPIFDNELDEALYSLRIMIPEMDEKGFVSCQYNEEKIIELSKKASDYLGINLENDFFNIGSLKEKSRYDVVSFLYNRKEYLGSEDEKEKSHLLGTFIYDLTLFEEEYLICNKLKSFSCVALIVTNGGMQPQENIEVTLSIPKYSNLIFHGNFPYPKSASLIKDWVKNQTLYELLAFQKTSLFQQYTHDFRWKDFSARNIDLDVGFGDPLLNQKKQILEGDCEDIMGFDIYDEEKDFWTIKLKFPHVKPHDSLAFPSYLLVSPNQNLSITYRINSNNLPSLQEGELIITN